MTTRIGVKPSGVYGRVSLQPQRFARKADGASAMEEQLKILRHTGCSLANCPPVRPKQQLHRTNNCFLPFSLRKQLDTNGLLQYVRPFGKVRCELSSRGGRRAAVRSLRHSFGQPHKDVEGVATTSRFRAS